MLNLLADLLSLLEESSEEDTQKIILEELGIEKRTVSARLIWRYFELLLEKSQMDVYFSNIGRYTAVLESSPIIIILGSFN
jgi:hypothetical protein